MARKWEGRFWGYVDRKSPGACWEWHGGRSADGYGYFWLEGRMRRAHELSWALAHSHAEQPSNTVLEHACDNPPCVNPKHLRLGDTASNAADRELKGRNAMTILRPADVDEIRQAWDAGRATQRELAARFRVAESTIRYALHYGHALGSLADTSTPCRIWENCLRADGVQGMSAVPVVRFSKGAAPKGAVPKGVAQERRRGMLIAGGIVSLGAVMLWLMRPKGAAAQKPSATRKPSPLDAIETTSTISRGETLVAIAKRLGDGNLWPAIFDLNRADLQRGQLVHPDQIEVGWQIRVPTSAAAITAALPSSTVADIRARAAEHRRLWVAGGRTIRTPLPDSVLHASF